MLQRNEIKRKLSRIEHDMEVVVKACQADASMPQELKDCVTEWKQMAATTQPAFESHDNQRLRGCVDDLEHIAHRAEMALQDVSGVDDKVRESVLHAQRDLLDLKRKLH